MTVWSFGDSWAAGYGLKENEKRFGDYIAEEYGVKHINCGIEGSSLGHILEIFSKKSNKIKQNDLVIFIIPPDIRWYNVIPKRDEFYSIYSGIKEYKKFIKNKNSYWFTYHHSLFIYTMINICKDIGCKFILAHNYGVLSFTNFFKSLIDTNCFLDSNKSLTKFLGGKEWCENYSDNLEEDGPPIGVGKYFLKNDPHPNERGHKMIANLIIGKINNV